MMGRGTWRAKKEHPKWDITIQGDWGGGGSLGFWNRCESGTALGYRKMGPREDLLSGGNDPDLGKEPCGGGLRKRRVRKEGWSLRQKPSKHSRLQPGLERRRGGIDGWGLRAASR
jgi:hypothetical protein